MKSSRSCPLCLSEDVALSQRINWADIKRKYEKQLRVDISRYYDGAYIDLMNCLKCDLRFFFPLIEGDNNFYNCVQKRAWYYQTEKDEYRYAKRLINAGEKVLEVGCGEGLFYKYIKGFDYTGIDISEEAISVAKEHGINVIKETISQHAIENADCYNVVCCFQVLEHVADVREFMNAILKCAKREGKIAISVPSEDSFVAGVTNNILNIPPHHITRWKATTMKRMCEIFNISLESSYHEKLQKIHQKWWMEEVMMNSLFRKGSKLVDGSLRYKIIKGISAILSKAIVRREIPDILLPEGHTATYVFRKR
jgi:SAM-dependent methyltransferase